jgi:hypothetical protein
VLCWRRLLGRAAPARKTGTKIRKHGKDAATPSMLLFFPQECRHSGNQILRADHPASGSSVACQANVVALSRTTNPDRIAENLTVFNCELGEDEMATIQTLAKPDSRIVNPAGLAPDWDAR